MNWRAGGANRRPVFLKRARMSSGVTLHRQRPRVGAMAAFQRKRETCGVPLRRNPPTSRAAIEDRKVLWAAVFHVGRHCNPRTVGGFDRFVEDVVK